MATPDMSSTWSPMAWSTRCPRRPLAAVADHGAITGDTVRPFYTSAHQVLHDIAAVGVDYDDVVQLLEVEGLTKFETSWALVTAKLSERLRPTSPQPNAGSRLLEDKAHS
jgi:hypothetical protein